MRKSSFFVRFKPAAALAALLCLVGADLSATSATKAEEDLVRQADIAALVAQLSLADVIVLGEVHDNAQHHRIQARLVEALQPTAIVWEMITQAQAETLTPDLLQSSEKTAMALDWGSSGWPDFALYAPVFQAAAQVLHFGALVPRAASQAALQAGVASHFGADAARFGLDQPLTEAEQTQREADQLANHCNEMPAEMLPMLVDFQRLRDTSLAAATERALLQTGGPVVVITGNGHARKDRGLSVYLARARPEVEVLSLGQMEEGRIEGLFDVTLSSPGVPRPDPCLAFTQSD